ncbi:MAG: reverse transcriptase family protein [Polyangiaceae bacterium]
MTFWGKVKRLLGMSGPDPDAPDPPAPSADAAPRAARAPARAAPSAPMGSAAASPARAPSSANAPSTPYRSGGAAPPRGLPDPYKASDILGLSAAETRKRSLKINPYKTAWIGRVDTIPPQSDERTALIDRGLILRGFLTEEEITEIHRVGDAWLKFKDAHRVAEAKAAKTVEALLESERKERAALRAKKKAEAEARRAERARAVAVRRATDIVYLGRGVSARLSDRTSDVPKLTEAGIPVLSTPADVARALALEIPALRHLAFHALAPERPHYVYFEVPKRSGGKRLLASPHARLRAAQAFIAEQILDKQPFGASAHGFVRGRSTVTNARPHVGQGFVVNLDLKDFFPSIVFPRVRGLFQSMGYSPAVSTLLALLTTEPPRVRAELDGKVHWVAAGERGLPQGACTSPALSNLAARKLDKRLSGLARKLGLAYTRYADDLTFSGPSDRQSMAGWLIARVRHIVKEEGFTINEAKGRVQRKKARREVTGIVVNDKPGVPREEVRALRAILHGAKSTGLDAQNRDGRANFREHVRGRIAYVSMVDPDKGAKLRAAFDALPR